MRYSFKIQERKRIRVIIDTDAGCEADDQLAIVHALLTPKFIIKGIVAEQFNHAKGNESVEKSYSESVKILNLLNQSDIPVFRGTKEILQPDCIPESRGADFIIDEALTDSPYPLFILCMGALSNMAVALKKCPEIAKKATCIWIGGGSYPNGGWEYNLFNDFYAANTVLNSEMELWQIPYNIYAKMQLGYAELEKKVKPFGEVGKYLFDEVMKVGMDEGWNAYSENWCFGDSPAVGVALNPDCGKYDICDAFSIDQNGNYAQKIEGRKIRVYNDIDARYIFEDFFAKLSLTFHN